MARRADLPPYLGTINAAGTTPYAAVLLVGAAIAGLVIFGSVKTNWSFSALTVLIHYAIRSRIH